MKKRIFKITSFILVLSLFTSLLTIFPIAEDGVKSDETKESLNVIFNRDFADGWDYTNGMNTNELKSHHAELQHKKMSASWHNYYVSLTPRADEAGYLRIDTGENMNTDGKLFLEFDISANASNNMGGVVMTSCPGESTGRRFNFIVRFDEGRMKVLGKDVGAVPESWATLRFVFDFDYASTHEYAMATDYRCTAYLGDTEIASRVLTAGSLGFGIESVYFGMQGDMVGELKKEDYLHLDNVKLYTGVNDFTVLDSKDYGACIDTSLKKTVIIEGGEKVSGDYISGSQEIPRVNNENTRILLNRHFGEGWGLSNGFSFDGNTDNTRGNNFTLEYDYDYNINADKNSYLNYYLQVEAQNNRSGYITLSTNYKIYETGKYYFEFDLKAAEGCDLGYFMQYHSNVTQDGQRSIFHLCRLVEGNLYILGENVGKVSTEWTHLAFEFDFDYASKNEGVNPQTMLCTVLYGEDGKLSKELTFKEGIPFGLSGLRIGMDAIDSPICERVGDWYALDNVKLYQADGFAELPVDDYGILFNKDLPKDFVIDSGFSSGISSSTIFDSAINMKIGVDYCLFKGARTPLLTDESGKAYGAPMEKDGEIYVPLLPILDYTGATFITLSGDRAYEMYVNENEVAFTIDRPYATVNGESVKLLSPVSELSADGNSTLYVQLSDIETLFPGYYVMYDNMGLVTVSTYDDFIKRSDDGAIDLMLSVMKRFIYDYPSDDRIYELAKEHTDNFNHPYLIADEGRFTELRERYYAEPGSDEFDQTFIEYVDHIIARADGYLEQYAELDENGIYVKIPEDKIPYNPYPESGGYDPAGGRVNILSEDETGYVAILPILALAYQLTEHENYVRLAYDWSVALCNWEHWGPAHFLNCAKTTGPMSLSYDWLYDAYSELGLDSTYIRDRIYRNGVLEGWQSVNNIMTEYPRAQAYAGYYHTRDNNWNAQCSNGMILGSLALLDTPEYVEKATYLMEDNIFHLANYGLNPFAPDGSYPESSGYWAGTVKPLFMMIAAMQSTMGTDFGYLDTWGLHKTNYYGCHIESSDYNRWNYNDDASFDNVTYLDTCMLYFAGDRYQDYQLCEIRRIQLETRKNPSIWDVFFYNRNNRATVELELDYYMEAIDAFVMRDSWETDALYTGIMGGDNSITHGDIDSGNWIYENKGTRWFVDLGMDRYDVYEYDKNYYKKSSEGQNVLNMTSRPEDFIFGLGQQFEASGKLIEYESNEYGAYAIIDNTEVYGGLVDYARRGILLTNDRKTTVIQDEVSCKEIDSFYWFAHFDYYQITSIRLSDDKKTAYMTKTEENGETVTLRVSLVTANRAFKFEIMTAYDFVLDSTHRPDYSTSHGGKKELDRSSIGKLAINAASVLSFNVAIVIEVIDPENEPEVGYQLGWNNNEKLMRPMSTWEPTADMREKGESVEEELRGKPQLTSIISGVKQLDSIIATGNAFTTDLDRFYSILTDAYRAVQYYKDDELGEQFITAIEKIEEYMELYNSYCQSVEKQNNNCSDIVSNLLGFN